MATAIRGLNNTLVAGSRLPAADVVLTNDAVEITLTDGGRRATGHIRMAVNANDADTVTITALTTKVYEFDSGGGVGVGNISVTIGGTAAISTTNLRAAINTNQGTEVASAVHATDTNVVDIRRITVGAPLTLAESTAGVRIKAQDNAEEASEQAIYLWAQSRTVTAEDVSRGRVRMDTGMSAIRSPLPLVAVRDSASSAYSKPWNGALSVTGGVVELDNTGALVWAAGNVVDVLAMGL